MEEQVGGCVQYHYPVRCPNNDKDEKTEDFARSVYLASMRTVILVFLSSVSILFAFPLTLKDDFPNFSKVLFLANMCMLFVGIRLYFYFIWGTICDVKYFSTYPPLFFLLWIWGHESINIPSAPAFHLTLIVVVTDIIFLVAEKNSIKRILQSIRHPFKNFNDVIIPLLVIRKCIGNAIIEYENTKRRVRMAGDSLEKIEDRTNQIDAKTDTIKSTIDDVDSLVRGINPQVMILASKIEGCNSSDRVKGIMGKLDEIMKNIRFTRYDICLNKILKNEGMPIAYEEIQSLKTECSIDITKKPVLKQEAMRKALGLLLNNGKAFTKSQFETSRKCLEGKAIKKYTIDHLLAIVANARGKIYKKEYRRNAAKFMNKGL